MPDPADFAFLSNARLCGQVYMSKMPGVCPREGEGRRGREPLKLTDRLLSIIHVFYSHNHNHSHYCYLHKQDKATKSINFRPFSQILSHRKRKKRELHIIEISCFHSHRWSSTCYQGLALQRTSRRVFEQ